MQSLNNPPLSCQSMLSGPEGSTESIQLPIQPRSTRHAGIAAAPNHTCIHYPVVLTGKLIGWGVIWLLQNLLSSHQSECCQAKPHTSDNGSNWQPGMIPVEFMLKWCSILAAYSKYECLFFLMGCQDDAGFRICSHVDTRSRE